MFSSCSSGIFIVVLAWLAVVLAVKVVVVVDALLVVVVYV